MKYVIDLPDDYDCSWVGIEMPIDIKSDGTTYKRYSVSLEPYKPESEPEVFEVGDEVINSDNKYGYVLVPDYENDNKDMIILTEGYIMPQLVRKNKWVKTGINSDTTKKFIRFAYDALNEVDK